MSEAKSPNNRYTKSQHAHYDKLARTGAMNEDNHGAHNDNPDYWDILVGGTEEGWSDKIGLDFGCGCGRNVINMVPRFRRFDGVDISSGLVEQARSSLLSKYDPDRFRLHTCNGVDLGGLPDGEYDWVMSTIVLQHICVWSIRMGYLKEFFRVMKAGGTLSIQMRYGDKKKAVDYYHDNIKSDLQNVVVGDPDDLIEDLKEAGFERIVTRIRDGWSDHSQWIYARAHKPL